jgi:hypothetical protein
MVDYASYFQYGQADGRNGALESANSGPGCACSDCQNNPGLIQRCRSWMDLVENIQRKEWDPEQYLLCPPRVLGYILKEKHWAQLQVTKLEAIKPSTENSIEALFSKLHLADDPEPGRRKGKRGEFVNHSERAWPQLRQILRHEKYKALSL